MKNFHFNLRNLFLLSEMEEEKLDTLSLPVTHPMQGLEPDILEIVRIVGDLVPFTELGLLKVLCIYRKFCGSCVLRITFQYY